MYGSVNQFKPSQVTFRSRHSTSWLQEAALAMLLTAAAGCGGVGRTQSIDKREPLSTGKLNQFNLRN